MDKRLNFQRFLRYLLDDEDLAEKGARITKALLEAQSLRLTDISEKLSGKSESRYKGIQRFLKKADLKQALMRMYQEEAEFVIGDPTEMKRYKTPKTSYVGTLKDGKTAGYWLLVLSTPFVGDRCLIRLWFIRREQSENNALPATKNTIAVSMRSKSCWVTVHWCWTGSLATKN